MMVKMCQQPIFWNLKLHYTVFYDNLNILTRKKCLKWSVAKDILYYINKSTCITVNSVKT
jgi:hypothetical protein